MATIDINDLTILQGKTYRKVFMWEEKPIVRKPITAISLTGGSPVLSVTGHGALNGQNVLVMGAKGMPQINAPKNPPPAFWIGLTLWALMWYVAARLILG